MAEPEKLTITFDLTWFKDGDGWLYKPALLQTATEAVNAALSYEGDFDGEGTISGRVEHRDRPPIPIPIWVADWELE